jgi:hypothetical protein
VVIPAEEVERLDPGAKSTAAGTAELPLSALEEIPPGLPLVLETLSRGSEARARAEELSDQGLPVRAVTGSGLVLPAAAVLLLSVAAALLVVAAVAGLAPLLAGLPTAGLVAATVFVVLAVATGGGGAWAGWSSARRRADLRAARRSHEVAVASRDRLAGGRSGELWGRIAALRRQIALRDLPPAAEADLRGGLKEVEAHLEAVGRMLGNAEDALGRVDLAQLRTRLASLSERSQADPSLAPQRDRLGRTVADLEALEEQQHRLDVDLQHIGDALDEIQATLGHAHDGGEVDPGAVDRLLRSTRLARETFDQLEAAPSSIRTGRDPERA